MAEVEDGEKKKGCCERHCIHYGEQSGNEYVLIGRSARYTRSSFWQR